MSWASERLSYLLVQVDREDITAATGLSARQQDEIIYSGGKVEGDTYRNLRNLYQRTAYSVMRETGFSNNQASRFSSYAPNSVLDRTLTVANLISDLTSGALDFKLAAHGESVDEYEYNDMYNSMRDSIVEGMQNSKKMYEQWTDEYASVLK